MQLKLYIDTGGADRASAAQLVVACRRSSTESIGPIRRRSVEVTTYQLNQGDTYSHT